MSQNNIQHVQSGMNVFEYVAYIGDERAQTWLAANRDARAGVFIPFTYMDIVDKNNPYDAFVLAQIMHWAGITEKNHTRMMHQFDEHLWIVKTYDEWKNELHYASSSTVKACFTRLADKGLIVKETHKSPFHGFNTALFVRPNWSAFLDAIESLGKTVNVFPERQDIATYGKTGTVHPGKIVNGDPLNTKITTKKTAEDNGDSPPEDAPPIDDAQPPLLPDTDSKPESESPDQKPEPNPAADIFTFYAQNIGNLTPHIRDTLTDALQDYPADWIIFAMSEAVKNNVRKWNYCEKILRRKQTEAAYTNPPPLGEPASGRDKDCLVRDQDDSADDLLSARKKQQPVLLANETALQTPWQWCDTPSTITHAWQITRDQMELQLDPVTFDTYLRDTRLIDFHPDDHTFVFATQNDHIRDTCQHRLSRHIGQVLSAVYDHPVQLKFLSPDAPATNRQVRNQEAA